ncbi:hypothetical protein D3C72_1500730 [compost metagenome]
MAQTDLAEVARKIHFALTVEAHAAARVASAGIRSEARFQHEASLQAATQVFRAHEADTRRVVVQARGRLVTRLLAFHRGVDTSIHLYAALSQSGGGAGNCQACNHQTVQGAHRVLGRWVIEFLCIAQAATVDTD